MSTIRKVEDTLTPRVHRLYRHFPKEMRRFHHEMGKYTVKQAKKLATQRLDKPGTYAAGLRYEVWKYGYKVITDHKVGRLIELGRKAGWRIRSSKIIVDRLGRLRHYIIWKTCLRSCASGKGSGNPSWKIRPSNWHFEWDDCESFDYEFRLTLNVDSDCPLYRTSA